MDIRIVNTCNNNCLYCLEQSYRVRDPFIGKETILNKLSISKEKSVTFYGGNPLLHPDLEEILSFCKQRGFSGIGLLTNTEGLTLKKLQKLVAVGLKTVGFSFHSFDKQKHTLMVNGGIAFSELLAHIEILQKSGVFYKSVIHINKQNVSTLYRDVFILHKKYGVESFEFINYFPFDRPYDSFRKLLEYDYSQNRLFIDKLFEVLKTNKLSAHFVKFDRAFFGKHTEFYNYQRGVLEQIGDEDILRLKEKPPFCLTERRCEHCFIKDNCKFYV